MPAPGFTRYFLDVAVARHVLATVGARVRWPAAMFELPYEGHVTTRRILAGGPPALAAVRDLTETVRRLALSGDDDALLQAALVPASRARLRTPVPDPPLWMVLHGNGPIVWRKQEGMDPTRHIMTRVPAKRVRTVNALLGQDEPLYLPPDAQLSFGAELGFVIGAPAYRVSADHAYRHVAGYLCTNDGYSNMYTPRLPEGIPRDVRNTGQITDKATDGCGPAGPWIVTHDEVGDPHDLMLWTRQDGRVRNRSHTSAHTVGVEDAVERLSHLFTLQPGTIVSLGAAGWDGIEDVPADRASGRTLLEVEAERVGTLRTPVYYPDAPRQAERAGAVPTTSWEPWTARRRWIGSMRMGRRRGIRVLLHCPICQPRTASGCFWAINVTRPRSRSRVLRRRRCPPLLPTLSPAWELPPPPLTPSGWSRFQRMRALFASHASWRSWSGPNTPMRKRRRPPSARGRTGDAARNPRRRDRPSGLVPPVTDYERRFSRFLGYCGDGRHFLGQAARRSGRELISPPSARRSCGSTGAAYQASTADYAHDAAATVAYLSRAITLLPGDVIGLGPLGPAVEVPSEDLVRGVLVEAELEGLAPVRVRVRQA